MTASIARPPVEHSPRVIGEANAALLDSLALAHRAILKLAEEGYRITGLQLTGRRPVITVAYRRRLRELEACTVVTRGTSAGRYHTRAAIRHGAQIQWREPA